VEIEEAKRRAKSGPALLLLRRIFAVLITFLSTITIARLVTPREFGLATMSAVLLSLGEMFRDFGLTNAVLRKGSISDEEMTLIFWCNCVLTMTVAALLAIASPFVADFYHEPVVKSVLLVSLIGFVSGGMALQHRALINRELRFGTTATIDAASLLVGFLVSLALAIAWRNVWAIVLGTLAQALCAAGLSVWLSRWKPGRPRRSKEFGSLLRFGANTSIYSVSTFFSQNAASILIGHFLGSAALGQYNRAQALFQMPTANFIQPLTQAAMPLLTRLRAHEDEYRTAYLSLVRKMCSVLIPFSIVLAFSAGPLVQALLGPNWYEAGLVLSALAPALIGTGFGISTGDLFVTQDRSPELRTLGLYDVGLRVGCVAFGSLFGLVGTALGFSLSTNAAVLLRIYISGRKGPVSAIDQLRAGAPGVPMAIGAIIACMGTEALFSYVPLGDLTKALTFFSTGAVGALTVGMTVRTSRTTIIELAETFGLLRIFQMISRTGTAQ
jgi:PST family polysaccharide transporter